MSDAGCLEALLALHPYLDGELTESEAEQVRRHFELCSPCTPALHYLKAFHDALQRAAADQARAPDPVRLRVHDILRAQ